MTDTLKAYHLIGAGGTGSILFEPLDRFLASFHGNRNEQYIIAVHDGDHVEHKNLERQLFSGRQVDENKANALVARHPQAAATAIPHYLDDKNWDERMRDGDTILIAVDNFPVRAMIERRGADFDNLTVINGGNESTDGSVQIWIRRGGVDLTPRMSFDHPELLADGPNRAAMTCEEVAQLPGGEQTIVANMMSATQMLNALRLVLEDEQLDSDIAITWTEAFFDLNTGNAKGFDKRKIEGWTEVAA